MKEKVIRITVDFTIRKRTGKERMDTFGCRLSIQE